MGIDFRKISPIRTCTKSYANYRSYKPYLAKDFNNRCGYTDCSDFWFGGKNSFHIDHFKPWKNNPVLKTTYSNLVYCCSYVNILKSDDESDYLDPCDDDFNAHFERDVNGNILPKVSSTQAIYMYKKLKLYLKRYQIIWKLDEIFSKMNELKTAINNSKSKKKQKKLLILQGELANEFTTYMGYLKSNQ